MDPIASTAASHFPTITILQYRLMMIDGSEYDFFELVGSLLDPTKLYLLQVSKDIALIFSYLVINQAFSLDTMKIQSHHCLGERPVCFLTSDRQPITYDGRILPPDTQVFCISNCFTYNSTTRSTTTQSLTYDGTYFWSGGKSYSTADLVTLYYDSDKLKPSGFRDQTFELRPLSYYVAKLA